MEQQRVRRPRRKKAETREVAEEDAVGATADAGTDSELLEDVDELLDEIDAVLEDQAVLTGFRQRSG